MKSTAGIVSAQRKRDIVAHEDVRIEVISEGSGPLLVLLPSRGRDSEDYDEVAAGIAKAGARVLRPQPRGTGASRGPMNGLTLHDFARDVAAVIEHAGGGPAVVVGHAFGNWIARMTAADHPQLVRGVAILAAAAKTYPGALAEAVTRSADVTLPDAQRLKYLRSTFFAPGHETGGMVGGGKRAAPRPSGGARSFQAARDGERAEERVRRARHYRRDPGCEPRPHPRAACRRRRSDRRVDAKTSEVAGVPGVQETPPLQIARVEPEVILDKARDEEIAVVVTRLQAKIQGHAGSAASFS